MKKSLSSFHKNIKLHIIAEGLFRRFVVFDTERFLKYLELSKDCDPMSVLENNNIKPIIGSIVIEKHPKEMIWSTISIAAEHGYGPLLYEIAMSNIYPHYLSPDDPSRVSDDAKNIWKKFCSRKDTNKKIKFQLEKPFELINHPALKINPNYCLFYQYKINKPINYQKYLIGKKFIKKATNNQIEFEEIMSDLASNFFIDNYILLD